MAESVVREDPCSRGSGSWGTVWPSQWFVRVYVVESVVHEGLCSRISVS